MKMNKDIKIKVEVTNLDEFKQSMTEAMDIIKELQEKLEAIPDLTIGLEKADK